MFTISTVNTQHTSYLLEFRSNFYFIYARPVDKTWGHSGAVSLNDFVPT